MTRARKARGMRRGPEGSALPAALVAAALLAATPAALAAQQAGTMDGDTLVLTLEDALRIAEANNPAYRQTVNDVGLNAVDTRATWATQVLPNARLGLFNTNYQGNLQRFGVGDFGDQTERPDAEWSFSSRTSQSVSLNWNLQGTSIVDALRGQKLTNRGRHLAEEAALADLTGQLRRRYFEVLEQRELVEVERGLAAAREADLELARSLFRLARNSRVDVLNAELGVEQQALSFRQQRNTYEQEKLALRTLLGDDGLGPFRLAEEPLPVFDPSTLDAEDLVARAEEINAAVRQARSVVETSRVGARQAKNAWWPDLSVSYNVYRRVQQDETRALFDVPLDQDLEQNFSVSVGFPFFNDYFGNKRSIEEAEVAVDNARERLRETRLQTGESVRTALLDLQSQHESLRLARRSLDIAEEALELARDEYRIGTRTFEQLQQSVQSEADARRQVITARFGFVDALLSLEEAVGAPVRGEPPVTDRAGGADGGGPEGSAHPAAAVDPDGRSGG